MRKRYAAIDIGTNSTLLLVAETGPQQAVKPILQRQTTTRLGKGLHTTGSIAPDTLDVTIATLNDYCRLVKEAGAAAVIAAGTHVFRAAHNQPEVLAAIREKTGLTVRVLAEEEEAALSFRAARTGLLAGALPEEVMLVDIGGGSTEIIRGNAGGLSFLRSYPVGAVTLTEQFLKHDPMEDEEYQEMADHIDSILPLDELRAGTTGCGLLGVAGTITTLATVDLKLVRYDAARVHGHVLTRSSIIKILAMFKERTLAERRHIPGLPPDRADIIMAGTTILLNIMTASRSDRLVVSDRGLRFGMVLEAGEQSL
jgi:exopolyphosphatase/guanosine-5'-triphosphate,3'-diphosphate pyrophosphatase